MKLECIRHREGGTIVELDSIEYHFAPQADGRHVAEVSNPAHLRTLLRIDAYQIPDDIEDPATPIAPAAPVIQAPAAPIMDGDLPPLPDGVPTEPVSTAPITDVEGGVDGEEEESQQPTEDAPTETPTAATGYAALAIEDLHRLHLEKLGRKAHPEAKRETLIAKLEAQDAKG